MNKTGWALATISILIIIAASILFVLPGNTKAPTIDGQATTTAQAGAPQTGSPHFEDMLVVDTLRDNDTIASPLAIVGRARGGWYFEASFPVQILNASGTVIAEGPAQAGGDWMTENYVPFTVTLTFPAQPAGSPGAVILRNDNPSGLPENDKKLEIPVTF